jgi:hypothetical protein
LLRQSGDALLDQRRMRSLRPAFDLGQCPPLGRSIDGLQLSRRTLLPLLVPDATQSQVCHQLLRRRSHRSRYHDCHPPSNQRTGHLIRFVPFPFSSRFDWYPSGDGDHQASFGRDKQVGRNVQRLPSGQHWPFVHSPTLCL